MTNRSIHEITTPFAVEVDLEMEAGALGFRALGTA